MNIKKMLSLLLVAVLLIGIFAACGNKTTPSETTPSETTGGDEKAVAETIEDGMLDGGVTNPVGLPIVNEPVTISVGLLYQAHRPDMETSSSWEFLKEKTGIGTEITAYKDKEKVDLLFASRDLPDFFMNIGLGANQINNAIEAGDFVPLEPLLEEYLPTWKTFFDENELAFNASKASDGKLYSLPYIDFAPFDRNIRDQLIIIKTWLDELNLAVPTTTEEFKNALVAIKANAGTGTIPTDVVPFYYLYDGYVGGQFDIYNFFGVYITDGNYLVVEDGIVKSQAINPDLKEPLKYLKELYELGLTPPECFTDDWATYTGKISSVPPITGVYSSYANRHLDIGTAFGPLDSGNGTVPLIRSQPYTPGPANAATITSNNPYPIATVRMLEYISSDLEALMTVTRGKQGVLWDYDENGKAYQLFWEESPEKMTEHSKDVGFHNSFLALKDDNFYENLWDEKSYEQENSRAWAYKNIYEGHTIPNDMVYVGGYLLGDDEDMMRQYQTDVGNYRKAAIADFITGKKDIDADWDAYVSELERLGLHEYVALKQKAYDILAG